MFGGLMQMLFRRGRPAKERRRLPAAGGCPRVGAKICRRHVTMTVTQPLQQDLWDWLVLMGWREAKVGQERRRYKSLPEVTLKRLIVADRSEREVVYRDLFGGI